MASRKTHAHFTYVVVVVGGLRLETVWQIFSPMYTFLSGKLFFKVFDFLTTFIRNVGLFEHHIG